MKKLVEVVLKEQFDFLEAQGYDVFFVSLYGSQRYGLDTEESDYDLRVAVLPSFEEVILGKKMTSKKLAFEYGEIDVKDLRVLSESFLKQNINFLEIISDEMVYVNPKYKEYYQRLFDMREEITSYDPHKLLSATKGMVYEKLKALDHPYPSKVHLIEEFGYDGKQLSHILRLEKFLKMYLKTKDFYGSLTCPEEEMQFLVDVKRNRTYSLEDAKFVAETVAEEVSKIVEVERERLNKLGVEPNLETKKKLEELMVGLIRFTCKDSL